jgi:phytanoyl-CoA hydroxylase
MGDGDGDSAGVEEVTGAEWNRDGYVRLEGFLAIDECRQLLAAARAMVEADGDALVRFEDNLPPTLPAEQRVSKLYRFHRHEPFRSVATDPRLVSHLRPLIRGDIDVFLSQVVWKVPGAMGQPWHQDSSIFPFEPSRPVVAAWIALTGAGEDTSCLRVVPGSHGARVAPHGRDRQSPTAGRYVALTDQDVVGHEALVMAPGDLVVFDSHLVHASGDNSTDQARAALCFHFAAAGTIDRTAEVFGESPYNDWMPVFRAAGSP